MLGTAQEPYECNDERATYCRKCGHGVNPYQKDPYFTLRWLSDSDLIEMTCKQCGFVWYRKPDDTYVFVPYVPPEPSPAPAKKKWWRRA